LMMVKMVPIQMGHHDSYKHHALDMSVLKQPTVILPHFGKPQLNFKQQILPKEHEKRHTFHRAKIKNYPHPMKSTNPPKKKFQLPPIHFQKDPSVPEQTINDDIINLSDNVEPSTKFVQLMADDIADQKFIPTQVQDDNNPWITPKSKRKYNKKSKVHTTVEDFVQPLPTMPSTNMDINQFHRIAGHVNDKFLHTTAKHYGIQLTGTLAPCVDCALAKIHKSPISKESTPRSHTPGNRIFMDISYIKHPSSIGSQFWLLLVDDATDFAWSFFLKRKSDTTNKVLEFLDMMKKEGHPVKIIRCDNSGENTALKQAIKQ
jgi:hypothetical protein